MARLTLEEFKTLRLASAPLASGVAPFITSELYKSPRSKERCNSQKLNHHLSVESQNIDSCLFKKLAATGHSQKIIRMGVGRPNAELYPWTSTMSDLSISAKRFETAEAECVTQERDFLDVETALNGNGVGSPQLVRFLTEHVELVHDPPYRVWGVCLTTGSTSSMEMALRILCNVGDIVLSEEFTYPGFLEVAGLVGVRTHGVTMDAEGLRSNVLEEILNTWDPVQGSKPHVLYVIPTGQNPTGCTQSVRRRRAIYETAERHDLIIIEDDPYYFLNLEPYDNAAKDDSAVRDGEIQGPIDYCVPRLPSFLSMDSSGRVVRLDSFSKILCPGLRAGWLTTSSSIIDKFITYNETGAGAASGPSQLMLCRLLENSWGHRGLFSWLADLSRIYSRRRNVVERALKMYIPRELCRYISPRYGMFLWLQLDLNQHHYIHRISASDVEARLQVDAFENGVQVTKGSQFATGSRDSSSAYLRITYAAAAESELEEGVRILANSIMKEFGFERA